MSLGPTVVKAVCAPLAVLAATSLGIVLLSGSDQPVTAHGYSHWQELAAPPLTPRTHALGIPAGHRVLVLGGLSPGRAPLHDGAAYDVRTGTWHHVTTPVAVTDRDSAAVAAGVVVLRHVRSERPASWWRYDARRDAWSRLHHVPRRAAHPTAFGSEVYVLSGHRVVVYSVQLGRWTGLPADRLRPRLHRPRVTASGSGTVVTGYVAGRPHRLLADRWDGLGWRRSPAGSSRPVAAGAEGETRVRVNGRTLVVRGDRAWIRVP